MYTSNKELKTLIQQAKDTGELSERLACVLCQIAEGMAASVGMRSLRWYDADDLGQDLCMQVMTRLHLIDVRENVFAYLSEIAYRQYCGYMRREKRWEAVAQRMKKGHGIPCP